MEKFTYFWKSHSPFSQLKQKLLETKGTIVEASPVDRIWGVGLSEDDPRIKDRKTWKGKNWLGEALTQLRDELLKNKGKGFAGGVNKEK